MTKNIKQTADNTVPDESSMRLFERVANYLDANDWQYNANNEVGYFDMRIGIMDASIRVIIDVTEVKEWQHFGVYSIFPVRAPESRRAALLEAINRINLHLPYGNLEMDLQDGEMRVRTSVEADIEIPDAMLEHVIHASLRLAERYFAPLMAVAYGNAVPDTVPDLVARDAQTTLQ